MGPTRGAKAVDSQEAPRLDLAPHPAPSAAQPEPVDAAGGPPAKPSQSLSPRGNPCCVAGCRKIKSLHAARNIYFYRFPLKDAARTEAWTRAMGQTHPDGTPWQPQAVSRICSFHFVGGVKVDDPLSPAYVPSIFPTEEEAEVGDELGERLARDPSEDQPSSQPPKALNKLSDLKKLDEIDWLEAKAEPVFLWEDDPEKVDRATQTTEAFEAPESLVWICQRRAVAAFDEVACHSTMVSIPRWGARPFPARKEKPTGHGQNGQPYN